MPIRCQWPLDSAEPAGVEGLSDFPLTVLHRDFSGRILDWDLAGTC